MGTMHTRRKFLTRGLTVLSAATTMPLFLQRTVLALNNPADHAIDAGGDGAGGADAGGDSAFGRE